MGRAAWLSLICEVLPRALLSELKLSRMLLGSSSAEQFFLVLTEDDMPRANGFLQSAADAIAILSDGTLRLHWVSTENLGAWPVVRKRLDDALSASTSAPLAAVPEPIAAFAAFSASGSTASNAYFEEFSTKLTTATRIGWSPEAPAHLRWDDGQYSWALKDQSDEDDDGILFPRRYAMDEDATRISTLDEMAELADGAPHWGVLRGDVDQFDIRLRQAASIEEHIHVSVVLKKLIAGELAFLCTLPEFWRKVSLAYRGGDDFVVVGAWDALIGLAREIHRVFESFAEANFEQLAGVEGKTISMALAIAPELSTPVQVAFEEAGMSLRGAKANEAGTFHLFGRTLEWKRLSDAEELKTSLTRTVREFGLANDYIRDLVSVYRESFSGRVGRTRGARVEKPWRTYMRVSEVIPQGRGKELANLRSTIITHLLGRKTAGLKLRASARVGLEWARLAAES